MESAVVESVEIVEKLSVEEVTVTELALEENTVTELALLFYYLFKLMWL